MCLRNLNFKAPSRLSPPSPPSLRAHCHFRLWDCGVKNLQTRLPETWVPGQSEHTVKENRNTTVQGRIEGQKEARHEPMIWDVPNMSCGMTLCFSLNWPVPRERELHLAVPHSLVQRRWAARRSILHLLPVSGMKTVSLSSLSKNRCDSMYPP